MRTDFSTKKRMGVVICLCGGIKRFVVRGNCVKSLTLCFYSPLRSIITVPFPNSIFPKFCASAKLEADDNCVKSFKLCFYRLPTSANKVLRPEIYCSTPSGFIVFPNLNTVKCRCGPVLMPVLPTLPILAPALTTLPRVTSVALK